MARALILLYILCKLRIVQILQHLLRPFVGDCREEALESLAFDIKAMLAALRKLRRQWMYQKKAKAENGDSRDWPAAAYSYDPVLLEMLTILNVQACAGDAEDGGSDEDESQGGCLFDVSITAEDTLEDVGGKLPKPLEDVGAGGNSNAAEVDEALRLLKKRRVEALDNLKGRILELEDSGDEAAQDRFFWINVFFHLPTSKPWLCRTNRHRPAIPWALRTRRHPNRLNT